MMTIIADCCNVDCWLVAMEKKKADGEKVLRVATEPTFAPFEFQKRRQERL